MKKLIRKLLLLFISIQFAACEGNLEPHLYGVVDTGNAFSTPADLSAATVALYYELRQKGWGPYLFCDGSSFVMDEVATEEWTTKWSWVAFLSGAWTDADQMVKGFYNWTAPNITRCTYTIAKMEESPVSQSVKDLYIAEVRALRAFFMFDIYRLYGPMPMIIEADQAINPNPDYKPYRPTAEEVGTFITTELRAAADILPIEQSEYGRITKGAALHYLLKYYMHSKLWQKALDTANEIIGLNYYEMEKDYTSIFSAQNEGNKELIFVVRAEPLADYGNHTYANILPGDYASPHGNVVEGWSGHRMPWEFYDSFDENDKRRTLAQAEYKSKSGATVDLRAIGDVGALPLKYGIDPESTGTWAGNDKVLDRYAEVLLFKAEALNELNGPNQESVELINSIRKRAFGFGTSLPETNIFKEEFKGELSDDAIGVFTMNNYDQSGGSVWTYEVDKNNVLGGGNSLHLNVETSGSEFWTLQMRTEPLVAQGRRYSVKMKLKASKDINFDIRIEGPLNHLEPVSLKADEVKEITLLTSKATENKNCAFFLALGNTGSAYDLWIDDIEFTAVEQLAEGGDEVMKKLSDFPDKDSMRDWILKERGWEFWYEGKRREDLIRMGRYIETGKIFGTNFSEKNLLFPIPTSVIIENSHIEQNPLY